MGHVRRTRTMRAIERIRGKDLKEDITQLYWPNGVGQPGGLEQSEITAVFLANKWIADELKTLNASTISRWMQLFGIPTRQSVWRVPSANGHQP